VRVRCDFDMGRFARLYSGKYAATHEGSYYSGLDITMDSQPHRVVR
jgi:hypothetical protein